VARSIRDHLQRVVPETPENLGCQLARFGATIERAQGQFYRAQSEIGATPFIRNREAVATETQIVAVDAPDSNAAGADNNNAAILAAMGAKTGDQAITDNAQRGEGVREGRKLLLYALATNPGDANRGVDARHVRCPSPASAIAMAKDARTEAQAMPKPRRVVAGPDRPMPSTTPAVSSILARHPDPPPSTPRNRAGAPLIDQLLMQTVSSTSRARVRSSYS
jgi:hypothetical protein